MKEQQAWQEADAVLDRLLDLADEERDAALAALDLGIEVGARASRLLAGHRRTQGILERRSIHAANALRRRFAAAVHQSRQSVGSGPEFSGGPSWQLAMYAWLLAYAPAALDVSRVVQMLLLHHAFGGSDEMLRRSAALSSQRSSELLALWREFEAASSEEAKFARALGRYQPLVVDAFIGGARWCDGIASREEAVARYGSAIAGESSHLWSVCEQWIGEYFASRP